MDELRDIVQNVFRNVFDDESIVLDDSMSADDLDGWDSLMHLNLIIALEKRFKIKFATAEISRLKAKGQNLGNLIELIARKTGGIGARGN